MVFLNSEHFQNYLIEKITTYYAQELKCEIHIKHVKFKLTHFELDSVTINDQQGDSLCRIGSIDMYPRPSTLITRHMVINKIVCHSSRFNFMVHPGVKGTNIEFLRKYFLKKNKTKTKRAPAVFDVSEIYLDDCSVTWSDKRRKMHPEEFDLSYLAFNHLNVGLDKFRLIDDSINTHIKYLNFVEKCGLKVDSLVSDLIVCDHEMLFDNFRLKTPYSTIKKRIKLTYDKYEDLEEPVDSVVFSGEIRESDVSMIDIRYFNHILAGMEQQFNIEGDFKGHINNLKTTNVTIRYGNNSIFKGKAKFRGLPEVDETYMDIRAEYATTNYEDLSTLLMTNEIPSQVKNIGLVKFAGNFNGFFHDFVTDGKFESHIGTVSSNINMKLPLDDSPPAYSGSFTFNNFDMGKFYEISNIGTTDLTATVKAGRGFKLKDLQAEIDANISRFNFNNYNYNNSIVTGKLINKKFIGKLNTVDPNINLVFDGLINLAGKEPTFKYVASIKDARLLPLHFDSNNTVVSTKMNIDFTGSSLDMLFGKLLFTDVSIDRDSLHFPLKKIELRADTRTKNGYIALKSEIADIAFNGEFDLQNLQNTMQYVFYHYLPNYVNSIKTPVKQKFSFNAELKNTQIVTDLFFPKMHLGKTLLNGRMNSDSNDIYLNLQSQYFYWDQFQFKNIYIKSDKNIRNDLLHINNTIGELRMNDSISFTNITLNADIKNDSFNYKAISYEPRQPYDFDLNGFILFHKNAIKMVWNPSRIQIVRKNYSIAQNSSILFQNNMVYISNMELSNKDEQIKADGVLGKSKNDELDLQIKNFDIGFINAFVKTIDGGIHGKASGTLQIKRALQSPVFIADIYSEKSIAGVDTLGDLQLATTYDDENNSVHLDAEVLGGNLKGIKAKGDIDISKETRLNIDVDVPATPVKKFEYYTKILISNVDGNISGKLKVKGTPSKPLVTGKVYFDDVSFTVDYIKTRYRFSNQFFDLYDNYIDLNKFYLFDEFGKTALVSGKVYHKSYEDYRLDVHFNNCKNFHCLQTTKKDNSLYYGSAYASGNAYLYGTMDDLGMDITAKSEKGTVIYIPLGSPEEASNVDFIKFIRRDSSGVKIAKAPTADLSGIRMNFNFEITPVAEIQIIFDEALGDIMKGSGSGNLRMEIDTRRNFNMYGQYTIEKGEYLFTALNVFQKKFYVKPGGTISWDGAPLEAKMNLAAFYRVRASPDPLLGTTGNESSKITVDCNLFLKGLLFSPDIKFGLSFPDIENQNSDNNTVLNTVLKQVENDQEELNRQIFSLMMLKQFLPRQGTSSGLTAGSISQGSLSATVSDLISAQMSNWLTQVAPGWEINFNYNPGNVDQTQKRQIILQLVKRFLDDKLILEGSVTNNDQAANPWQYNFSSQYIISKDGRMRIKAFSRSNNNVIYNQNVTTHGIGFFYRREFETMLHRRKENEIDTKK